MAKQSVWSQVSIWPLVTASASAAALTALLLYGMQSARTLQAASTALQRASELSVAPQVTHSLLSLVQRSLENRTFAGDSLQSLAANRDRDNATLGALRTAVMSAGLAHDADIIPKLAVIDSQWSARDRALQDLRRFDQEDLYVDNAAGSGYSANGAALKRAVDGLLREQAQSS